MWHPDAGLVVSPNTNYIPETTGGVSSQGTDYSVPSLLNDNEIYLAFRPRFARNAGDLFGRLNLNRQALEQRIVPTENGKSILNEDTLEAWARLENAFLDVIDTLLCARIAGIPTLTYPKFPWQFGYRDAHATRDITLRCALRSQEAFLTLSSVVTFSLSLYMDESGRLDDAYRMLVRKSTYKVHTAWLDMLSLSYACNFSPHFRVGGFVNPYTSQWMSFIPKFVQAQVPIWILWGHGHGRTPPRDSFAYHYSPPENVIVEAQARSVATTSLILPTYRYDPFAINQGISDPFAQNDQSHTDEPLWAIPPPPFTDESSSMSPSMHAPEPPFSPSSSSAPPDPAPSSSFPPSASLLKSKEVRKQEALAALWEYFDDLRVRRENRLKIESDAEKKARIAREALAERNQPMKKSTVFQWIEQDDGTYRRELVNSKQVSDEWSNFTPNQRRYTGHLNQWDLCPQLPRYSEEKPKEAQPYDSDDSEYDSDPEPSLPPTALKTTIAFHDDRYRDNMDAVFTEELRGPVQGDAMEEDGPDVDRLDESHVETFDFETFLRDRFGYDLMSPHNWSSSIAPTEAVEGLTFEKAMRALSFEAVSGAPNVSDAVLRLVRLLSNTTWTFSDLPVSFDHSSANRGRLSLASDTLAIEVVPTENRTLYIVHKRGYIDKSPWAIATLDASTVLLIFRRQWSTVEVIARELVQRGVPFRTVAAITTHPAPLPYVPSRGLGARPQDHKTTIEDYTEYVRRRNDLLRGPKGRAALLRGGIVARIARGVIETDIILDGPSRDARPVGEFGRFTLVDDELTQADLDIICGVYYVKTETAPKGESFLPGTRTELSWWPQENTWVASNCFLQMEWTELAEAFYQENVKLLRTNPLKAIRKVKSWRKALRKQNTLTKIIEAGAAHYQAGYLQDCHRLTRFVSYLSPIFRLLALLTILFRSPPDASLLALHVLHVAQVCFDFIIHIFNFADQPPQVHLVCSSSGCSSLVYRICGGALLFHVYVYMRAHEIRRRGGGDFFLNIVNKILGCSTTRDLS